MSKYLLLKEELGIKSLRFYLHLFSDAKVKIAGRR